MIGAVSFIALMAFCAEAPEEKPLWLVVGRPGLVEAIEPLAEARRAEGFRTEISTNGIKEAIADAHELCFLLLVGDDEEGKASEPWYLPAQRVPFYKWNEKLPDDFASDAAYGDLDGDGLPDIPVGRIPARDRKQVETVVAKILATFMVHAGTTKCNVMKYDDTSIEYTPEQAAPLLDSGPPTPLLVFYTCWSGNFVADKPVLTESFLFMPSGPVAVIGATMESHPIPNAYSGVALLRALGGKEKRVGDIWLATERDMLDNRPLRIT